MLSNLANHRSLSCIAGLFAFMLVAGIASNAIADDGVDPEAVIDEAVSDVDEDPAGTVSEIIQAFQDGRWAVGAGLLVMFLVWILREYIWKYIPKNIVPWLALSLAMVVTVAVGLVAGTVWWQALIDGLLTGSVAMAFWSMLFKHILPNKNKKTPQEG